MTMQIHCTGIFKGIIPLQCMIGTDLKTLFAQRQRPLDSILAAVLLTQSLYKIHIYLLNYSTTELHLPWVHKTLNLANFSEVAK